jgi:hypothetical protein
VSYLLEQFLGDIARRSGLPLTLDAGGSCAIEYGGEFQMTLTAIDRGEGVLLHAPLLRLSRSDPLTQLRRGMEMNLYGAATDGATLGLSAESEWIILSRRLPLTTMDSHGLEQAIVAFADLTRALSARLDETSFSASAAETGLVDANVETQQNFIKA